MLEEDEEVKWSRGQTAEFSPGADSLRTSTSSRAAAAHAWSTSAEAGRRLH